MPKADPNVAVLETPELPEQATTSVAPESARTPEPSYAPFLLALGITMVFWGIATSPVMSVGGFVLFAWALWLWIGAIARGWRR
jgi:hypothetical protein